MSVTYSCKTCCKPGRGWHQREQNCICQLLILGQAVLESKEERAARQGCHKKDRAGGHKCAGGGGSQSRSQRVVASCACWDPKREVARNKRKGGIRQLLVLNQAFLKALGKGGWKVTADTVPAASCGSRCHCHQLPFSTTSPSGRVQTPPPPTPPPHPHPHPPTHTPPAKTHALTLL